LGGLPVSSSSSNDSISCRENFFFFHNLNLNGACRQSYNSSTWTYESRTIILGKPSCTGWNIRSTEREGVPDRNYNNPRGNTWFCDDGLGDYGLGDYGLVTFILATYNN